MNRRPEINLDERPVIELDDELTEDRYAVADRIVPWLERHPGIHNRSTIARGVKADYGDVAAALEWLVRHSMAAGDGNGSWRKYGAIR